MTTKMEKALAGNIKPAGASRFQTALSARRVLEPYTIPGIDVTCKMTIIGAERELDLRGQMERMMSERGMKADYANAERYELQFAVLMLAEAARDDDAKYDGKPELPPAVGTRETWGSLSREIIAAAWQFYRDLKAKHDPLADLAEITKEEFGEITEAVSKKNRTLLRWFGLERLCAYLLILDSLPETSPTPKSSPGESSLDSSSSPLQSESEAAGDDL